MKLTLKTLTMKAIFYRPCKKENYPCFSIMVNQKQYYRHPAYEISKKLEEGEKKELSHKEAKIHGNFIKGNDES